MQILLIFTHNYDNTPVFARRKQGFFDDLLFVAVQFCFIEHAIPLFSILFQFHQVLRLGFGKNIFVLGLPLSLYPMTTIVTQGDGKAQGSRRRFL